MEVEMNEILTTDEKTEPAHTNLSSRSTFLHRWNCSRPHRRSLFEEGHGESPALHASMALQRLSQAASALLCMKKGTVSARALANASRWTHCPPPRLQRPPNALALQESSGYTRSFLLRAACRAAPSWAAARLIAVPSLWRRDTSVVSKANWAPRHRVRPSAMTSSLQPSTQAKPRTKMLVATRSCLPAHLCCSALEGKTPPAQNPNLRARCTMVAKYVELAAPNPPMDNGKCARTFADIGAAGVPNMARKQSHTRSSCLSRNAKLSSGRTMRNQKLALVTAHITATTATTPGCLRRGGSSGTTQPVQCSSSPSTCGRKRVTELVRPTLSSPVLGRQRRVTPPHDGIGFHRARSLTASVPHLGLALVQIDVCVTFDLLCQIARTSTTPSSVQTTHTSFKNANSFQLSRSLCTASKARCCRRTQHRHERIALLLSSPCGISCMSPISSSHKSVDGLPLKHWTNRRTWSPSSILKKPSNIEFLEIKSHAPMPSMDTTVALLCWSVKLCKIWAPTNTSHRDVLATHHLLQRNIIIAVHHTPPGYVKKIFL